MLVLGCCNGFAVDDLCGLLCQIADHLAADGEVDEVVKGGLVLC